VKGRYAIGCENVFCVEPHALLRSPELRHGDRPRFMHGLPAAVWDLEAMKNRIEDLASKSFRENYRSGIEICFAAAIFSETESQCH
jgi:hypothetical protein